MKFEMENEWKFKIKKQKSKAHLEHQKQDAWKESVKSNK